MDFTLTDSQNKALARIIEFMVTKTLGQFMLIEGCAGTGKTTLMKMLVRYNNKMGSSRLRILCSALTHKAKKVIEKALNEGEMITIPSKTIANLLKKQRLNSYLGHKKYNTSGNSMADFDLIIIDEASMINDSDLEKLIEAARLHKTRILFLADCAQIPHPTQRLVNLAPDLLVKADSAVFKLKNRMTLTEIVRQKDGNPILEVAQHLRNNLFCTEIYGPYEHVDKLKTMEITQSIRGQDADLLKANPSRKDVLSGFPIKNMPVVDKSKNVLSTLQNSFKDNQPEKAMELLSKMDASLDQNKKITKEVQVGVRFVTGREFEKLIVEELQGWNRGEWRDPFEVRILSYTNESVRTYNKLARNARYMPLSTLQNPRGDSQEVAEMDPVAKAMSLVLDPILVGDLIMGYLNLGFPTPFIENGQDYLVVGVQKLNNHPIVINPGPKGTVLAVGSMVTFGETMFDSMDVVPATIKTHFFPDINSDQNLPILHELRARAKLINQPNSSTKAFKHYYELKDQMIFMECLYEFKGRIYSESHFFREHPLMATNVSELIKEEFNPVSHNVSMGPTSDITASNIDNSRAPVKNTDNKRPKGVRSLRKHFLYEQINALYPNLIEERMMSYHLLGDSEELGDRFLFIEKDCDWGYSITSHKAQASTYNRVYVNDADIAKIRDRWNYEHNAWYRGSKERNQLKYVAVTRARHLVTILSILKEDKKDNDFEFEAGDLFDEERQQMPESFDLIHVNQPNRVMCHQE